MLHPLSGSITGTGRTGYTALFIFRFTVFVLCWFSEGEQTLITVIFKSLFHNAVLLVVRNSPCRHLAFAYASARCRGVLPSTNCFQQFVIQSSCHPIVSELTSTVICLVCAWLIAFAQIKNRLPFRTSGSISNISCDQSVHSRVCANTPGSRYPLDPALKRHTLLSHSALSAAGIMVP